MDLHDKLPLPQPSVPLRWILAQEEKRQHRLESHHQNGIKISKIYSNSENEPIGFTSTGRDSSTVWFTSQKFYFLPKVFLKAT